MRNVLTLIFLLASSASLLALTINGPDSVCPGETAEYCLSGFDYCISGDGNMAHTYLTEVSVNGGTIVSFTTLSGNVVPVGSSSVTNVVDVSAIDGCNANPPSTPAGILGCARAYANYENSRLICFTVEWDGDPGCQSVEVTFKDRTAFLFFPITICSETASLEVASGPVPASTIGAVCYQDCSPDELTFCFSSCGVVETANWYIQSSNGDLNHVATTTDQCATIPNELDVYGAMTLCIDISSCGLTIDMQCVDLQVVPRDFYGPTVVEGCRMEYSLQVPLCGSYEDISWRVIYGPATIRNPNDQVYASLEFSGNGPVMLEVCFTLCGIRYCRTKFINVTRCGLGLQDTETDVAQMKPNDQKSGQLQGGFRLYPTVVQRGQAVQIDMELNKLSNTNQVDKQTAMVYDTNGRLIDQIQIIPGYHQKYLTDQLTPGLYFVKVQDQVQGLIVQ